MSNTPIPDVDFGAGDGDDVGDTAISTDPRVIAENIKANRGEPVNSTVNSGHNFGDGDQEPVIPPLEPGEGSTLEDTFEFGAGGEGGEDTIEAETKSGTPLSPVPGESDEPPVKRPAAKKALAKAPAKKKAAAKKAPAKAK